MRNSKAYQIINPAVLGTGLLCMGCTVTRFLRTSAAAYINYSINMRSGGRSWQMVTCHKESAIDFFSPPLNTGRWEQCLLLMQHIHSQFSLSHTQQWAKAIVLINPKRMDKHIGSANSSLELVVHRILKSESVCGLTWAEPSEITLLFNLF